MLVNTSAEIRVRDSSSTTKPMITHKLDTDQKHISALHPPANGNVKRKTTGEMLRTDSTEESGDEWVLERDTG